MKLEIDREVRLTAEQHGQLDLHSFFNVMGVVASQLQALELVLATPEMKASVQCILDLGRRLRSAEALARHADEIERAAITIPHHVSAALEQVELSATERPDTLATVEALEMALEIMMLRLREYQARIEKPRAWTLHNAGELADNLIAVLRAIEKNAGGRYRVVFDATQQTPDSYLVELTIRGSENGKLHMPPVMQDVLRDLVANARKYTPPGGVIDARLLDEGHQLRIEVRDNGLGIPAEQLESVVEFGYRASNVAACPTAGGGFGLTKAYFVVRGFGGRMWIESELGVGTTISCTIPRLS